MDQALSQIFPVQKIGSDGFNWWVGQVEGTAADEPNNKGGIRYKVRIVGRHLFYVSHLLVRCEK